MVAERLGADEVTRRLLEAWERGSLITVCSWCRRVRVDETWVPLPHAAEEAIDPAAVTHGICLDCDGPQGDG